MSIRRIMMGVVAAMGALIVGCPKPPSEPAKPEPGRPTLIEDGASFYVTGLPPGLAPLVQQGVLFAVQRPIAATGDVELVAVLDVIEAAPPESGTVAVAVRCQSLRDRERPLVGLTVVPLAPNQRSPVGQCLAKVAEVGREDYPQPYVTLDVGSHHGLVSGDVYAILGRPVVSDGYLPLGLDTRLDGQCQISGEPGELGEQTARCVILRPPNVEGSLHNRYVVFESRSR